MTSKDKSDFPDADFNTTLLHANLGKAITHWNTLEELLFYIFNALLDEPLEVSAAILAPLKTFQSRLTIIHSVAKVKISGEPEWPFWNSLHEYIREVSGDRNMFAHFYISHAEDLSAQPVLRASEAGRVANIHKPDIDAAELAELIKDIQECLDFAVTLLAHLRGEIEFAPEFWKPVTRRRLSRKERQANNPPKQKPRTPSSRK